MRGSEGTGVGMWPGGGRGWGEIGDRDGMGWGMCKHVNRRGHLELV